MSVQDSAQRGSTYSFLDFTLDPGAERLVRGTTAIKLRPKSFQVLRYLVERPGRLVTREELMQAVWGDVAVTDESITKCVADIRKAVADDSQEIVQTLPRRGFLFQAEVRIDQPFQPPPRPIRGWRTTLGAALVVIGLVAAVALWRSYPFDRRPAYEAIAVLPFESLSKGEDQQYLADGMTEALITNLGQASPLRVIARTSVNQYQKTKKPVREIARELNVDVVVEGTVTQSGDRLRVTANLIQVSPERHIWAHAYERSFRDALALQNEIAGAIAGEIQGRLTPRQQARLANSRPVNPEALVAYWKARYLLDQGFEEWTTTRMTQYAEQAVRIDPGYAAAHAALARVYAVLADTGRALPKEIMPRAKMAAQRAIALDEELPYAHAVLGYILLDYDWDWAGAEREARRAIALNPSDAEARWLLADYLAAVGQNEEAVAEMKRARDLSPLSFHLNWSVGRMLCLARKYDEALAELRQADDMQRNSGAVGIWIFKSYWMKGLADEAITAALGIHGYRDGLSAESLDALRTAYSRNGPHGYWAKLRELTLPKFRSNPTGWYRLAEINTYLGDKEEVFRWLEKAYEERSTGWMPFIKVDPTLDPLRSDPRFAALLQRLGLTP